jgi:hypothetical protein
MILGCIATSQMLCIVKLLQHAIDYAQIWHLHNGMKLNTGKITTIFFIHKVIVLTLITNYILAANFQC